VATWGDIVSQVAVSALKIIKNNTIFINI